MRCLSALLLLALLPVVQAGDAADAPLSADGGDHLGDVLAAQPGNETQQDPSGNATGDGDNATATPDAPAGGWDATDVTLRWGLSAAAVLLLVGFFVRTARH